jgi:hypothetical protein
MLSDLAPHSPNIRYAGVVQLASIPFLLVNRKLGLTAAAILTAKDSVF